MKKKIKLKDYPEYTILQRYYHISNPSVVIRSNDFINDKSINGSWKLVLTEDYYIYLVCDLNSSLAINTPDELKDEDRIVPYEFIPEKAFEYLMEMSSNRTFGGPPPEINMLMKLVSKDYKKFSRERKLKQLLTKTN